MNDDDQEFVRAVLENLQAAIGDRVSQVVSTYMQEVPRSIEDMRKAHERHDLETIKLLAHSLKSSSANVGAMKISKLAEKLELKLKQIGDDSVTEDINNLQQAFDQVRPMFSEFV